MGQRYGRIKTADELPTARALAGYFKQAIALNEKGAKTKRSAPRRAKAPPRIPPEFARALRANTRATKMFDGFSPSKKRDYIEWILDAKTEETRERRMETAVEWIAQGKSRNWKYQK